jgi:hypothetical protein
MNATKTTEKKITKREKFEMLKNIAEVQANPILSEFIEREIELLAKKNSAEKKPTEKQTENNGIRETILEVLTDNGGMMTITDIQKANAELGEMSNQRVSALIRQMILAGEVERIEDKRKAYFKAV